ncbi:MAG: hypothetical protein ACLKAK_01195 [Alkaliphilus sp.]
MMDRVEFKIYYKFIEKYLKKYSFINGEENEDLRQELDIKAYKLFQTCFPLSKDKKVTK